MALEIHTLYETDITDLVNNPEQLGLVSIKHDGESVFYLHDESGWFTFGAYKSLPDNRWECIEVTPETVITEIIRAIALSMEESVKLWLSVEESVKLWFS